MSKSADGNLIRLRGVRQNNLKNFDLDLPAGRLIVVTGLSGSGKSSLAFDTLYAEGQRRYIETFSPYARQFLDRMDKPQVDSIQGIPPAIAIEQRNSVKSTRSTVGTMTELCEYLKVVWCHVSRLHCRQCGVEVGKDSPRQIWEALSRTESSQANQSPEIMIVFDLPLSQKLSLAESLALISKQGYQRILLPPKAAGSGLEVVRIEDAEARLAALPSISSLKILQDRIRVTAAARTRCIEGCEQAYHFGKGRLEIHLADGSPPRRFSQRFHCARCDLDYREPSPALFSFNHPLGACPTCKGFGRVITIDYQLAIPNRSLTLAGGAVRPWQTGQSAECQQDLVRTCQERGIPLNVPFDQLAAEWQAWVIEGDPGYGKDPEHEWPRAWYGVRGYFRWLESRTYKMHVRVLLSRYRAYKLCPDCAGRRFQPEALLFKRPTEEHGLMTLADFYQLSVSKALRVMQSLAQAQPGKKSDALRLALEEVCARLAYLNEVGLGYLTLDRPTRSLSGGETERVNLTTCLGSRLVNTLFVLDEPTVGLHARDTRRLIGILERLRDAGNTVVVVEHEPSVMKAADQLVDLGPGHGESGGALVFQGTFREILKAPGSLTGQFLRGRERIDIPPRRPVWTTGAGETSGGYACPVLKVDHVNCHNLRHLSVSIPLARFVCVTGVSGSGKTTLVRDVLLPLLKSKLESGGPAQPATEEESADDPESSEAEAGVQEPPTALLSGWQQLGRVVLVDQSSLGKTPRSNPAVYIGAFELIRELFAQSEVAHRHALNASAFSFNSAQGQCELCRGAGFEKISMQFLSDVFVRCPACHGRRYRKHILDVKIRGTLNPPGVPRNRLRAWSVADVLDATVEEAIEFLNSFPDARPAARAAERLQLLCEVGLGYLRLGQPINTLSGGESQRLKLVSHLAFFASAQEYMPKPTLFLFDEPTTGLHFADVKILLRVFQRLVDAGHSVVVVEHNLDVIKCADWIVDLGPEAGEDGGQIVSVGTAESVAACLQSATGQHLREVGVG